MTSLLLLLLLLLIAAGSGRRIAGLFSASFASSGEAWAFSTGIGLGLISYLVLLLGLAGRLYLPLVALLLGALAVFGARPALALLRETAAGRAGWGRSSFLSSALGAYCAVVLLVLLVGALAPAAGSDWDGLSYHLAAPKLYLQQHRVHYLGWMSHSNFPFTLEMLYLLGLMLKGEALAKLFHWACLGLTALALHALAARRWPRPVPLLAAAVFVSTPLIAWEGTLAYNDLAFALFVVLALSAFLNWSDQPGPRENRRWLWMSALSCGLALGTKMLAASLLLGLLVLLVWRARRERAAHLARLGLGFAALAALVASPWYLKSLAWTGNPTYPFFYNIFGGKYWSTAAASNYRQAQLAFGRGDTASERRGPLAFLLLPWRLTMEPEWFSDPAGLVLPRKQLTDVIGPFFLALLPALLLVRPFPGSLKLLLLCCLFMIVGWFLTAQVARYLIPVFALLSVPVAVAATALAARAGVMRLVLPVMVGLPLAGSLLGLAWITAPAFPVALGLEPRVDYLRRSLGSWYQACEEINQLPEGSKVLLVGEPRGYYLDRDYMWGPGHHEMLPPEVVSAPGTLARGLAKLGITHLLTAPQATRALHRSPSPFETSLRGLLARGQLRLWFQNETGYAIWEVGRKPPRG